MKSGKMKFKASPLAYSFIIASLIMLLITQAVSILMTFGRDTFSQIKEYSQILQILSYFSTSFSMAAGVVLLAVFSRGDVKRRGFYIAGSVLLVLSFLPVVLQNISPITVAFGGRISQSEFFTILLIAALLTLVTYKFSLFSVGLSVFRGYRMGLVTGGFVLGFLGIGLTFFVDYEDFMSILTGKPSIFSPGLSPSYYVPLIESIHILDILSIILFIAVFALSMSSRKNWAEGAETGE